MQVLLVFVNMSLTSPKLQTGKCIYTILVADVPPLVVVVVFLQAFVAGSHVPEGRSAFVAGDGCLALSAPRPWPPISCFAKISDSCHFNLNAAPSNHTS